jgi:hypothetical protein
MNQNKNLIITSFIFIITLSAGVRWFMTPPLVTQGETVTVEKAMPTSEIQGKNVVIYLNTMSLELRDGNTVLETLPLVSQGKPGSYYETIGGNYINDYKVPLHFSSIGHVYMPYSVHLFGNYFIHGIPYYPDGKEVSSAYSGGCIRLENANAEKVYTFIDTGTPIIVTRSTPTTFTNTSTASTTFTSTEMVNLMVASISLEFLTQDNAITDTDGLTMTTRKNLLPRLLISGDTAIAHLYANSLGEQPFITAMNQKAEALGMTNTHFTSVDAPIATTYEDYARFMTYISTYKSYLREVQDAR